MLAVHNGLPKKFTSVAKNLMYTCYQMYKQMPTKLSPEIVHFNMTEGSTKDIYVKVRCSLKSNVVEWLYNHDCVCDCNSL